MSAFRTILIATRRLLLGSVAQKVLHEAGCPVMLVSHRQAKTVTTARETGRSEPAVVMN